MYIDSCKIDALVKYLPDHHVSKSVSVYTDHFSKSQLLVNIKVKSKAYDLLISARGTDNFESG